MSEIISKARSTRESLAKGLNQLQSLPNPPATYLQAAEPIAKAMGALHRLETGGDAKSCANEALESVRSALGILQTHGVGDPNLAGALETVAGSLGALFQLTQMAGSQNAPPAAVAQTQRVSGGDRPQTQPVVQAQPRAAAQHAPYDQQQQASGPQGSYGQAPAQAQGYQQPAQQHQPYGQPQQAPAQQPPYGQPQQHPPAQQNPYGQPQQQQPPAQQNPYGQPQQQRQPVQGAQQAGFAVYQQPAPQQPQAQGQQAPVQPQAAAPQAPAQQPPQQQPSPQGGASQNQGAWDPFAAPSQGSSAGPSRVQSYRDDQSTANLRTVEASLGAASPSNFYRGLSGDDVVEHGGLFIQTYQIPEVGETLKIHVVLPGGYEFDAVGVVRWTRESRDSMTSDVAPPGFGVQFTKISPEARQLVYRYVRNREPLFHDDF